MPGCKFSAVAKLKFLSEVVGVAGGRWLVVGVGGSHSHFG